MNEKQIYGGNKLIAELLKITPSNVEEIGELTLNKGLVNGYYRPYPITELFSDNFCKENPHVEFQFNASCSTCSNCSGYTCGGYILKDMSIDTFNQYKNIKETFGDPIYPSYNSDWNLFVPAFNKIHKIHFDKEMCELIGCHIRFNDNLNAFKTLINYIEDRILKLEYFDKNKVWNKYKSDKEVK